MRLLGKSTQTPARSLHINVESHLVPRDFLINISQTDVGNTVRKTKRVIIGMSVNY